MNIAYINPFIIATRRVFDTMIRVPLKLGAVYVKPAGDRQSQLYKICATIEMDGAAVGLFVLNLSQRVALALASSLAGQPINQLDEDCFDALKEIANMIAGNAKKDLPCGQVNLKSPSIVSITSITYPENMPIIAIPYDTTYGRLIMEITFRQKM